MIQARQFCIRYYGCFTPTLNKRFTSYSLTSDITAQKQAAE